MRYLLIFALFVLSLLAPVQASAWDAETTDRGYAKKWCTKAIHVAININDQAYFDKKALYDAFMDTREEFRDLNPGTDLPPLLYEAYTNETVFSYLAELRRQQYFGDRPRVLIVFNNDASTGSPYKVTNVYSKDIDRCIDYAIVEINSSYRLGNGNYQTLDLRSIYVRAFLEVYGLVPTDDEDSVFADPLVLESVSRELGDDDRNGLQALYPARGGCSHTNSSFTFAFLTVLLLRRSPKKPRST